MKSSSERRVQASRVIVALLCVALGVLIALQVKHVSEASRAGVVDSASVDELRDFIIDLQGANADLAEQNSRLRANLRELQGEQEGENIALNQVLEENHLLEIFSGLVAVEGPGAIITLTDGNDSKVDHNVLLTFINYMRAANAQGMALGDQRLVAMSEVMTTGAFPDYRIVVNGNVVTGESGQYSLRIIGERRQIESSYGLLANYINGLLIKGIGVSIDYPEKVQLPALGKDSAAYRFGLLEDLAR